MQQQLSKTTIILQSLNPTSVGVFYKIVVVLFITLGQDDWR